MSIQIPGAFWPQAPTGDFGPHEDTSNNRWVFTFDAAGGAAANVVANVSSDGGFTWTAYPSSGLNLVNYSLHTVYDGGSTVTVLAQDASNVLHFYTFDVSALTWSAEIYTSGTRPTVLADAAGFFPAGFAVRSTGELVAGYQGPLHSTFRSTYFARCSAAGVWQAEVALFVVASTHASFKGICVDDSDRVHVLHVQSNSSDAELTISAANAVSSNRNIISGGTNPETQNPKIIFDATLNKLVYAAHTGTVSPGITARAPTGNAPNWVADTGAIGTNNRRSQAPPALVYDTVNSLLRILYIDNATNNVFQNTTASTTWVPGLASLLNTTINPNSRGVCGKFNVDSIDYIYEDGGGVYSARIPLFSKSVARAVEPPRSLIGKVSSNEFDYSRAGDLNVSIDSFSSGAVQTITPASISGSTAISCTLVRDRAVSASIAGSTAISCTLVRTRARTASISGSTAISCSLVRVRTLTASISGSTVISCSVVRVRARSASIAGSTAISCTLVRTRALTASISGSTAISCTVVRVRARTASISGSTTITAIVGRVRPFTASISGSTSITCSVVRIRARSASIVGSTAITCSLVRVRSLTASISGSTTISCSLVRSRALTASISGSSAISCSVVRVRARTATISGSTTITASVVSTKLLTPSIAGSTSISCSLVRVRSRSATISGSTAISVSFSNVKLIIGASISGRTTITCSVVRLRARTATINGSTSISASISKVRKFTASISGSTAISCSLVRVRSRSASIHGTTTISGTVVRVRQRSANIQGSTAISCSLSFIRAFVPTIHGSTTITAVLSVQYPEILATVLLVNSAVNTVTIADQAVNIVVVVGSAVNSVTLDDEVVNETGIVNESVNEAVLVDV